MPPYSLTGLEALSLQEVATALGGGTRHEPETVEQAYASRAGYGAPDWQVDAWVSTYTAIAAGELATVTAYGINKGFRFRGTGL